MMPRRSREHYRTLPVNWPSDEELGVQTGLVEMMSRDNAKMREAGCNLAEAAGRVVRDYDGLHRLSIAISAWYAAVAGEGDRDQRHAALAPKVNGDASAPSLLSEPHKDAGADHAPSSAATDGSEAPASADTHPKGGDVKHAPLVSGAVGEAETPKGSGQ